MQKELPENAKLVFKGFIHDFYQWEQEMFDGTKNTYEMIKRVGSTSIIAVVGDKIILQEQEQPRLGQFLSFPGGRLEKDEEATTGAKRELLEETGYTSNDLVLWKKYNSIPNMDWDDYYFIARNCQKIQEPKLDNGEKIKNSLISFADFLMLSENEKFRHKVFISDLLCLRLYPEKLEEFKNLLFGK